MTGRALITGAAGFVGRHFSQRLLSHGWDVVVSDRNTEGYLPCDFGSSDDINALLESVGELSHVFHLAARTFVPDSMADPSGAFQVNLIGTIHLLNRLARMPRPPRVVFVGSAEAYGPPQFLPMTELHPLAPENPYAISKAAADSYCAYVGRTSALEIIRVRPFNHSGAGQSPQFVLSSFARQIAQIEAGHEAPVIHVGNLDARRDFSHVSDILSAYELLALKGKPGEAYNVSSGNAVRIGDALQQLLAMSTADIAVEVDPARMRPVDVPEVRGSSEKLRDHTGWQPERSFDFLLKELLDFWRSQEATQA